MAKPKTSNKQKRKKGKKFRFFAEQVKQDANDQDENPFESHFRNVRSDKSDNKRKKLVDEYKNRSKVGGILDRRFGGSMEKRKSYDS